MSDEPRFSDERYEPVATFTGGILGVHAPTGSVSYDLSDPGVRQALVDVLFYKTLLRKYMRLVGDEEGVCFVKDSVNDYRREHLYADRLTEEENAELLRVFREEVQDR